MTTLKQIYPKVESNRPPMRRTGRHCVSTALVLLALFTCLFGAFPSSARAQESNGCDSVRIGTVGWLDAGSGVALASAVLRGLNYQSSWQQLSPSMIFASLKNRNLDVFMEIMIPTMGKELKPYIKDNSIELIRKNLSGTKYTLAANSTAKSLEITRFDHIKDHGEALNYTIHGVETGSDGNMLIQKMIDNDRFGLGGFKLKASPEKELMMLVYQSIKSNQPLILLAWEPHPMNVRFTLSYLSGGDDIFGPAFGGAEVYTGMRSSVVRDCPNLTRLFKNMAFSLPMINEVMTGILELKAQPLVSAIAWLRQQPLVLERWLDGVTTRTGENGLESVRRFIGLNTIE